MTTFIHSINDIEQATGLTRKYIDRCYGIMPFLESYRRKAPEQNKYLYNAGALDVFQRIASLKQQGSDRRAIRRILVGQGLGSRERDAEDGREEQGRIMGSAGNDRGEGTTDSANANSSLSKIERLYERLLQDKEQQLTTEQQRAEEIRQTLRMLLPPGQTPAQVKAERDETKSRLADQDRQIKQLLDEKRSYKASEKGREGHRRALITEVEKLPWYARKRRQEILAQMKRLDIDG